MGDGSETVAAPAEGGALFERALRSGEWPADQAGFDRLGCLAFKDASWLLTALAASGGPAARNLLRTVALCPDRPARIHLLATTISWDIAADGARALSDGDRRWLLLEAVTTFAEREPTAPSDIGAAFAVIEEQQARELRYEHRRRYLLWVWILCSRSSEYCALYRTLATLGPSTTTLRQQLMVNAPMRRLAIERADHVRGVLLPLRDGRPVTLSYWRSASTLLRITVEAWWRAVRSRLSPEAAVSRLDTVVNATTAAALEQAIHDCPGGVPGEALIVFVRELPRSNRIPGRDLVRFAIAHLAGHRGEIAADSGDDQVLRLRVATPSDSEVKTLAPGRPFVPVAPVRIAGTTEVVRWVTAPNPRPSGRPAPRNHDIRIAELRDVVINRDDSQFELAGRRYFTDFHCRPINTGHAVYDAQYMALHDDFRGAHDGTALVVTPNAKPSRTIEHALLGSGTKFHHNFGHFLYQIVPNIQAFRYFHPTLRPTIVMLGSESGFHRQYFDYLGIDLDVAYSGNDVILCRTLHALEEPDLGAVNPIKWELSRHMAPPPKPELSPFGRRLYLSRQGIAARRVVNEDEVVALLSRFGFEAVVMHEHPPEVQVAILEKANVLVGPHGSAFANLMFCRQRKLIIEGHSKTGLDATSFFHWFGHEMHGLALDTVPFGDRRTTGDSFKLGVLHELLRTLLG